MAVKQPKTTAAGHAAGIFADMTLDGPEIGTLVAVVDRAKNLPNRKTMGKQDPYCAMRLGKHAKKTETDRRGGQTPKWDQELRFTVHESPDYYRLKCSVFNDDKKTDLIGESWIDLREVIVPGGGQNDLWHQLNFKGKYAGDIRIELTYYDIRPKPETPSDKKKNREKAGSVTSDSMSTVSCPRQLGPREIKRRPLPPGPAAQSAPAAVASSIAPSVAPLTHSQQHFGLSPSQGRQGQENPMYNQQQPYHLEPQQQQKQQWTVPETPDDYNFEYQQQQQLPQDPYSDADRHASGYIDYEGYDTYSPHAQIPNQYDDPYTFRQDDQPVHKYQSIDPRTPQSACPYPDEQEIWNDASSPISPLNLPGHSPTQMQHSSPYNRPISNASIVVATPPQQPLPQRNSMSPTKYGVYRDSPLRQSISQQDVLSRGQREFQTYDDLDVAPPPPPAHRGSLPRNSSPSNYSPNSRAPQAQRTPVQRAPNDIRSPLQNIEHEYSPHDIYTGSPPPRLILQHNQEQSPRGQPEQTRPQAARRNSSVDGELPPPHRISYDHDVLFGGDPIEQAAGLITSDTHRSNPPQNIGYGAPRRAQTFDTVGTYDDNHTYRSEPQIVRPRAVSPNANNTVLRKPVSPQPHSPNDRQHVGGMPFAPDSYDILNPGSSPVSSSAVVYADTGEAAEAARQREVDKLRDQGPIIGNDGRVIDPSDHLPADTWAPEPERKTRKPEHVIRFRTKDEVRSHSRQNSSPASVRPLSVPTTPYQSSPVITPPASNPSPSSGRNRLQKQMPTRPLPAQPFGHAQTSPASIPMARNDPQPPAQAHRQSMYSSPSSNSYQRQPLSEFQVPDRNTYSPRGSSYMQQLPPVPPPKMPLHDRGYSDSYEHASQHGDSLAAEMSMIDLGPSRAGGRTVARSSRGYGGMY